LLTSTCRYTFAVPHCLIVACINSWSSIRCFSLEYYFRPPFMRISHCFGATITRQTLTIPSVFSANRTKVNTAKRAKGSKFIDLKPYGVYCDPIVSRIAPGRVANRLLYSVQIGAFTVRLSHRWGMHDRVGKLSDSDTPVRESRDWLLYNRPSEWNANLYVIDCQ
jgi:hypothetical protein